MSYNISVQLGLRTPLPSCQITGTLLLSDRQCRGFMTHRLNRVQIYFCSFSPLYTHIFSFDQDKQILPELNKFLCDNGYKPSCLNTSSKPQIYDQHNMLVIYKSINF